MKAKTRAILRAVKSACTHLYTLFFLNGFLLCLIIYAYVEDQYEQETFNSLDAYILKSFDGRPVDEDSALLRTMHLAYSLETMHRKAFSAARVGGFIADGIHPVGYDFATGQGACGSAAMVLGRLLLSMHYPVRLMHMRVDGIPGGHHVVEVKTHGRWVVVDPLYDLHFMRPDGRMASFDDLRDNWAYYKRQTPRDYDMRYRYEGGTHTNWNRIPIVMPAAKAMLNLVVGRERADAISLRTIFLRKYHVLFIILLAVYAIVLSVTARVLFRHGRGRRVAYPYLEAIVQPHTQTQLIA